MSDFRSWAMRRQSRGGHPEAAPPAPRAQQALPLPPAGYAWGLHGNQYILVPLTTPAAAPSSPPLQPPIRQPSGAPSKAVETCTLVKPGNVDTYANLLAQLPDIVPDNSPYDAMAGNPSPQTIAEMGGVTEFAPIVGSTAPTEARSFLPGAVLAKGSTPLRGTG